MQKILILADEESSYAELIDGLERLYKTTHTALAVEPKSALRLLRRENYQLGFIFLSRPLSQIRQFITLAGSTQGRTCSFVGIAAAKGGREKVAAAMLAGIHAVLCQPFNEAELRETIALARKSKANDSWLRLRVATGLMVEEVIQESLSLAPRVQQKELVDGVQNAIMVAARITGESLTNLQTVVSETVKRTPPAENVLERVRGVVMRRLRKSML